MSDMPMLSGRTDVDFLHRPGQAFQSVLTGDVDGAWRSMLSPSTLGPAEKDALLNKWGIRSDSLQGKVLDLITNPAVLISLALTMRFPVPTAKNMMAAKEGVDGMLSRIPVLRGLSSPATAFADTEVPNILDNIIAKKQEIWRPYMEERLAPAFERFEQEAGHSVNAREGAIIQNWNERLHEKELPGWEGVGVLYPNLGKAMTQPMLNLAGSIRGTLDHTLANVFLGEGNQEKLRRALAQMVKFGSPDEDMQALASIVEKGGFKGIEDYQPHRIVQSELDIKNLREAIIATANGEEFKRGAQYKIVNFMGREFYERKGAMIPSLQDLQVMGDLVDPQAMLRLHNAIKDKLMAGFEESGLSSASKSALQMRPLDEILSRGRDLVDPGEVDNFLTSVSQNMPAQYSLKLEPTLQQYYHSVASTYAWTIEGHGPELLGEVQRAKALGQVDSRAAWRANMLENYVVPAALGRPSIRQTINAGLWNQRVGEVFATLDRPSVRNVIGDGLADKLTDMYKANQDNFSLKGLFNKASSYFYTSTLAGNVGSAFRNTFQPIITTGPMVGFKNAFRGAGEALSRLETYFTARLGEEALDHGAALAKAYPEFMDSGLAGTSMTDDALGRAFESASRIQSSAPAGVSLWQKVQRAMMAPFTTTEFGNRVSAFHAGLIHAGESGLEGAAALDYARKVVVQTQYANTLSGTPILFSSAAPLANPVLRQLAQFPLRTLEFTINGVQDALRGNPARLFRQIAGSYVTSEIGDVLGVSLKDALLGGALPTFTNIDDKGNILAPLPIVPPVVALGASVASYLGSGDWENVQKRLPLLIPGGVGLSRLVGYLPDPTGNNIPQAAARWLNRKYANYQGANPDTGRIPVYTGNGALTGYYKPWEIIKNAMGIRGSDIDQEQQVSHQLTVDADQMRQTRQEYLNALFTNDSRGAAGIEQEYENRFGHKLAVTSQQIQEVQQRRKMTRIERQLTTLPPEARSQYESAVFQNPASASFTSGRYKPKSVAGPQPTYTNDMGVMGSELDPYSISRYRNVPATSP